MGQVVLYIASSLDGRVAGAGHDLSWLEPFSDALAGFEAFQKTLGAAVMGRTTFDVCAGMEWAYGALPVRVLTRRAFERPASLPQIADVTPVAGSLESVVESIRRECASDVWLVGGGDVVAQAIKADVIDRIRLFTIPVVLGEGPLLVPHVADSVRRWKLTATQTFSSGVVELDLVRDRASSTGRAG